MTSTKVKARPSVETAGRAGRSKEETRDSPSEADPSFRVYYNTLESALPK